MKERLLITVGGECGSDRFVMSGRSTSVTLQYHRKEGSEASLIFQRGSDGELVTTTAEVSERARHEARARATFRAPTDDERSRNQIVSLEFVLIVHELT